ncbi:sensor histidine kinase [Aquabacterium sp. A7-Y]|uniref:sensor histidine kinase n=1 Tax=Aquabacterium sp. A7-Y TaxID=1349605 RepID=UPI00223DE3CF|nr:sensor histidine kinase [Aquabacterium sp. A7-Y]MCW7536663.1 sensor histidine kinase [Aquabacterium sp. A7-Y]
MSRPPASPQGGATPSRWQVLVARLRAARLEVEAAAARSGQVPASLLRRVAVLKLAVPITLLLGGTMLWVTEQGYQRLERMYSELRTSRSLTHDLNSLSFLSARSDATQAEYLLLRSEASLAQHRSVLQDIGAMRERLALNAAGGPVLPEMEEVLRYIDAEHAELKRLEALPPDAPPSRIDAQLKPNPIADGALRQALGRMVLRERERLDVAELAAAIEVRRQRWWSLLSIAFGMFLLILLFQTYRVQLEDEQLMAHRLQEERDRLERAVRDRTRELSELATHLQHMAEQEKARLARELHDELGAILTASKMDVGMLLRRQLEPKPAAIESLKRLQETLERGVQLKRRVIEGLVPTTLRNLGLSAALEALADEVEATAGIRIERRLPDELVCDGDRSIAVYRIVQEALTNVQKHARAKRVELEIALKDEILRMRLADDGVGISTAGMRKLKSHGLRGIKHRVDAFHGRFHIGPCPQGGTELRVEIPMKDIPDEEIDTAPEAERPPATLTPEPPREAA